MSPRVLAAGLAARIALVMVPVLAPLHHAAAQGNTGSGGGVASRVEGVTTGTVRMVFAAREGVCGDGMNWYRLRTGNTSSMTGSFNNSYGIHSRDVEVDCETGPVRVVVVRDQGVTRQIRTYVGGRWKADTGITDLGTVPARDAAAWLLTVAGTAPEGVANNALSTATLADSTDAAAALLRIVSDEKRPSGVRSSALGWLGEVAGEKVAARLDSIAYEPGDREIRKQAIYAMSRRPAEEAVPNLLKMAETLPDRELRKTAVFWLARSKDPRALAWITRAVEK
ncbi:MAG: HEAT repeat domain-containing protein [Gemmatimonadota bacterium]